MKLVLLSGGSGKRLWPLSNDARSKQFLKVLEGPQGERESMVQRVWRQLQEAGLAEDAVIATGKAQTDMIQSQLGTQVPLVIEPCRRDTFPAIALAASYLYSVQGVDLDEVIGVLPVDPYVEEHFFLTVKELEEVLNKSNADLALIGVKPTYPSEKYGYIVPKEGVSGSFVTVNYFVEKPSERMASELIEAGALWNCGVFGFKLGYLISLLKDKNLPTSYDELLATYETLPKISFDYEVVERVKHIATVQYNGFWKDLGTWNTLTEEMAAQVMGKGVISEDSKNTHLLNELDIPVTVLGLSNVVVAASPDGILVTEKDSSPKVKEIVAGFDQRPMYEERRWGWYRVLDYTKFADGTECLTKRIGIKAGSNLSYQIHKKRAEVWTVIKGEGEFAFEGRIRRVSAGDVLNIPRETIHSIRAISELEFIEVQTGSELIEEDIVRLLMSWAEIKDYCKKNT